jgi:hypothetical protein
MSPPADPRSVDPWPLLAVGVILAFSLFSAIFAASQAIWVDETTQLFGLSLPLDGLLAWLAGAAADLGGVPPDRNPPLAYLY